MQKGDWERVLTEATQIGCKRVQFIGGEVLLVPYLLDLIHTVRDLEFSVIEVYTNATLLDDCTISAFQEAGVRVATSFYCHEPTIHERITSRRGSWQRTLSSIDRLQARRIPLRVGVIEMDDNRPYIAETIEFLRSRGVANVGVDRARSFGRATTMTSRPSGISELCGKCGNARVCVAANGDVYPCIMSKDFPVGNVFCSTLRRAVESDALAVFRRSLGATKKFGMTLSGSACEPTTGEECRPDYCAPDFCCEPNEPQPE